LPFIFTALDYFRRIVIRIPSSLVLVTLFYLILNLDTCYSLKLTECEAPHMLTPSADTSTRMWNVQFFTSRDSAVGIVTRLRDRRTRRSLSISSQARDIFPFQIVWLWDSPSQSFNEYGRLFPHLPHVIPRLRMSGAVSVILHMLSMCHQGQHCLTHIRH
jgi:hypothetical protein